MKLAGRQDEIEMLENILKSDDSEFVAMYGRRRIGKTYLLRQVFQPNIIFEVSGIHENEIEQQLENFWFVLLEQMPKLKFNTPPKTWLQAFALLKQYILSLKGEKKKVIFLDEISWFDTPRSGFLAALDNFWNQFCSKRDDIILTICGSAASWIINKVINNRGGLHNRVTKTIRLFPFTLAETNEFLLMKNIHLSKKDIIELYMCIGGVPFYYKDITKGKSVVQIINELCFVQKATLKNEFNNLYASLFKNAHLHVAIVSALAKKGKGLTRQEIITETGLSSGGGMTTLLNELIQCGFVTEIYPINKATEDRLYRLIDEFSLFYFKFMYKSKITDWTTTFNKQSYKIWCGYAFETICIKHTRQIKYKLGISGIASYEYSWIKKGTKEEQGSQIDLLIDRADNCISMCEIKFHNAAFEITQQYADTLRDKREIFRANTKTKKNIFITFITLYGLKQNEHSLSIVSNEVVGDDLF
jgi:uncharacterized protein